MTMKYLYDSHLGGVFTSDRELSIDERFCDQCFDCDTLIGTYTTVQEFWALIKPTCSIDGSGGLSLQWLWPFMVNEFKLPVEVTYNSYNDKCQGFCNLSEAEIINSIENVIKETC